jgi:hypothetical protein
MQLERSTIERDKLRHPSTGPEAHSRIDIAPAALKSSPTGSSVPNQLPHQASQSCLTKLRGIDFGIARITFPSHPALTPLNPQSAPGYRRNLSLAAEGAAQRNQCRRM